MPTAQLMATELRDRPEAEVEPVTTSAALCRDPVGKVVNVVSHW